MTTPLLGNLKLVTQHWHGAVTGQSCTDNRRPGADPPGPGPVLKAGTRQLEDYAEGEHLWDLQGKMIRGRWAAGSAFRVTLRSFRNHTKIK